jgi:2-polyprenyl-6-methoxyphenol hydroxylase-like FAD-dependent oxidoreductase
VQQVLIVGAGPTGLTLACELLRHGVDCRIIDRRGVHVDRSRGADVQARTLEVFDSIGIVDEVMAAGRRVSAMTIYDSPRALARLKLGAPESRYPFTIALPQTQTEEILERRLEELGGKVERGVRLDKLVNRSDGVDAVLHTASGETHTERVAWVVGCDGVASTVRNSCDIEFEVKGRAQSFTAADATIDWHLPPDEISLFISADGFLLLLPLPGERRVRVLADTSAPEQRPEDLDGLASLASRHAGGDVGLQSPGLIATYHVQRRLAKSFRQGRVLLAGDAAHSFNPVGGHGMNQGVQDAHNLGWKLALVVRGDSPEGLLSSYESERRNAAKSFVRELDFKARLQLSQHDASPDDYERLMDFAVGAPPLRRSVLDAALHGQMAYDSGPYVREQVASGFDVGGGVSAGRPVPGTLGSELIDPARHTVLLFTGESSRVPPSVPALAGDLSSDLGEAVLVRLVSGTVNGHSWPGEVVHDSDGALHRRFGASLPCAYVVRPDSYVAYRCCPLAPEPLRAYLSTLFAGVRGS